MICDKCRCTVFKPFDEFHTCCCSCGTLNFIPPPPILADVVLKMPSRSNHKGQRSHDVQKEYYDIIDGVKDRITTMRTEGMAWKKIVSELSLPCGEQALIRNYAKVMSGNGIKRIVPKNGKEEKSIYIQKSILDNMEKIDALVAQGVGMRTCIKTLGLLGEQSTVNRWYRKLTKMDLGEGKRRGGNYVH